MEQKTKKKIEKKHKKTCRIKVKVLSLLQIRNKEKHKKMKAQNLKRGMKIRNSYGQTLTVLEIVGSLMIRTYEDFNNLYHPTKVTYNGNKITA